MINIYISDTSNVPDRIFKAALKALPEWRGEYVSKYKNNADKINGTVSYLLLKKAATECFGEFDAEAFIYSRGGKPYFSKSKLFFSMSHCKNYAAAAVSRYEIGLDILDNRKIDEKLAHKICSDEELKLFLSARDKRDFLLSLWNKKESLAKLSGDGFAKGIKTTDTVKTPADFFVSCGKYFVSLSGKDAQNAQIVQVPINEICV